MIYIKEADIVQYLINNWNSIFYKEKMLYNNGLFKFYKKEYKATDEWRCDILAYIEIKKENNRIYRMPIYTEVKFNNNGRDLINELSKGLYYVQTRGTEKYPRGLCVIADDTLDKVTLDFIAENQIPFYQFSIQDNDLTTFKIHKITN